MPTVFSAQDKACLGLNSALGSIARSGDRMPIWVAALPLHYLSRSSTTACALGGGTVRSDTGTPRSGFWSTKPALETALARVKGVPAKPGKDHSR